MKKAFTLIELLVVIAIIAILAAILFPVFAQAKAAAKKTVDLSNVKQTSLASLMYSGDSDDNFVANGEGNVPASAGDWTGLQPFTGESGGYWGPYGAGAGGTGAPLGFMDPLASQNWGRETQPYVKSMDMMVSPGAKDDTEARFAPSKLAGAGKTSYVMNGCVSNRSQTAVSKPGEQIVFQSRATTTREAIAVPRRAKFADGWTGTNDTDLWWVGYNFSDGGNYGFADGHAKFMKHSQVKFKNLGFWEWVNIHEKGWTDPNTNPTLISTPKNPAYEGWRTYGACDPAQVP